MQCLAALRSSMCRSTLGNPEVKLPTPQMVLLTFYPHKTHHGASLLKELQKSTCERKSKDTNEEGTGTEVKGAGEAAGLPGPSSL